MNITEVSRMYEISADTLRYYERIGLIPPVNRRASGNRDYTEEDCRWVRFVKCMRSAGLSIESLIEYVALFQKGSEAIGARKEILLEQRRQLSEKLEELQNTIAYLDKKIDGYEERMVGFEADMLKSNKK